MTPRHIALALGGLAVFATAIFLFVEVRSAPAQPPPSHAAAPVHETTPVVAQTDTPAPPKLAPAPAPPPKVETAPPPPVDDSGSAPPDVHDPANQLHGINPFKPGAKFDRTRNDSVMNAANRAYDKGDFDEARQMAGKVLATEPGNERMLRIMVSAACIEGDSAEAQKYYNQLPARDRSAMKTRCDRYGVNFTDPPGH